MTHNAVLPYPLPRRRPTRCSSADDALVYAQRLGEWISPVPRRSRRTWPSGNVGLDLLGQARVLLNRAGELPTGVSPRPPTEDELAYLPRRALEFRNVHLVEQPRSDFGFEMARMLRFLAYQCGLYPAGRPRATRRCPGCGGQGGQGGRLTTATKSRNNGALRLGDRHRRSPTSGCPPAVERGRADRRGAVRGRRGEARPPPGPVPRRAPRRRCGRPRSLRTSSGSSPRPPCAMPAEPTWRSRRALPTASTPPADGLPAGRDDIARSHPGATWCALPRRAAPATGARSAAPAAPVPDATALRAATRRGARPRGAGHHHRATSASCATSRPRRGHPHGAGRDHADLQRLPGHGRDRPAGSSHVARRSGGSATVATWS